MPAYVRFQNLEQISETRASYASSKLISSISDEGIYFDTQQISLLVNKASAQSSPGNEKSIKL